MSKTEKIEQIEPRIVIDQNGSPVGFNDLVDIRFIKIDPSLPRSEREKSLFKQMKNPYLLRCEDMVIRMSFPNNGVTLTDLLKQYLLSKAASPDAWRAGAF